MTGTDSLGDVERTREEEIEALYIDPYAPSSPAHTAYCREVAGAIDEQSEKIRSVAVPIIEGSNLGNIEGGIAESDLEAAEELVMAVSESLGGQVEVPLITSLRAMQAHKIIEAAGSQLDVDPKEVELALLLNRRALARMIIIPKLDGSRGGIDGSQILFDDVVGDRLWRDAGIDPKLLAKMPSYSGWFTKRWGHPKSDMTDAELLDILVCLTAKPSKADPSKIRTLVESMGSFRKKFEDVIGRIRAGETPPFAVQAWAAPRVLENAHDGIIDAGLDARAALVYEYLLTEWVEKLGLDWEQMRTIE